MNPVLDALLKAAKDTVPLSPAGSAAHSLGTLYPTALWSLVETYSPAPAPLVLYPWMLSTRSSMAAWLVGSLIHLSLEMVVVIAEAATRWCRLLRL